MRLISYFIVGLVVLVLSASSAMNCLASDYNSRFIRNYPPGYYGMWYKAERFYKNPEASGQVEGEKRPIEIYAWDIGMSKLTNLWYPFMPIPYEWDYGTHRSFNLPDYNSNDWN